MKNKYVDVDSLSNQDFRLLRENVNKRLLMNKVSVYMETPYSKLICPYCKTDKKYRWGVRNQLQRYKCRICKKTYNSLTNTPLSRLRLKQKWLDYSNCLKDGVTIRDAAEICDIHKSTSFRWRHRFLVNSNSIKASILGGIIDFRDIYFKESFKGQKNIEKNERRDVCVIQSIDRTNNIFDVTDVQFSINTLNEKVNDIIKLGSIIVAQKNEVYQNFCDKNNIKFKMHYENKKSITNSYKIDNVRDYCLRLKEWIYKHFRGVATKYLENYVSWFRGLNEFQSEIRDFTLLLRAKRAEKYRYQPLKMTEYIFDT